MESHCDPSLLEDQASLGELVTGRRWRDGTFGERLRVTLVTAALLMGALCLGFIMLILSDLRPLCRFVADLLGLSPSYPEDHVESLALTPVEMTSRRPLTPISPTAPSVRSTRVENAVRGRFSAVSSRDAFRFVDESGTSTSLFDVLPGAGMHFSSNTSDHAWDSDLARGMLAELPLREWIMDLFDEDGGVHYDDDRYDGDENYSDRTQYGVGDVSLVDLLSGVSHCRETFLKAEGQTLRMLLSENDDQRRYVLLQVWVILMGRMCGVAPLQKVLGALKVLDEVPLERVCGAGTYMVQSWRKLVSYHVRMYSVWLHAMNIVDTVREELVGENCYDAQVCGLHLNKCVAMYNYVDETLEE
jgi:hypothetical protein